MKMLLMMTVMLIKIMISMKLKMNVNATMATKYEDDVVKGGGRSKHSCTDV